MQVKLNFFIATNSNFYRPMIYAYEYRHFDTFMNCMLCVYAIYYVLNKNRCNIKTAPANCQS